jgi:hypothetical protein
MSVGPIRPPDIAGTHNVAAQQADAAPSAELQLRPQNSSLGPAGWMPHHGHAHGQAARWIAAHHSAVPSVTIGVRAGGLVPPNGSFVRHAEGHVGPMAGKQGKPASQLKMKSGKSFEDHELDQLGKSGHAVSHGAVDALDASISGRGPSGEGADSGGGDSSRDGMDSRLRAIDAAAHAAAAEEEAARGAAAAFGVETDPAVLARRLQDGQTCWVQSLKLAMQCAQMHPGRDVFVLAFLAADEDGHVLPLSGRSARLRARPNGTVLASPGLADTDSREAAAGAVSSDHLLREMQQAPLLGLSLRPVVDESGRALALLDMAGRCELSHLAQMFERPLPPALRAALLAEAESMTRRWDALRQHADFCEKMARHGDALQRLFDTRRAQLSTTIRANDAAAVRAQANWQRAQQRVAHWAEMEREPDFDAMLQVNALLGEGLKPWNRADLADGVGARYGALRHFDVVSGVPPQHFLRADQLARATCDLFDWLALAHRQSPIVFVAAQFEQRVVTLHPFADANGRTARLMADWLLLRAGLPVALLAPAQIALFPNEAAARNPPPGHAEQRMVDGLLASIGLYQEWLQIEELAS